MSSSCIEEVSVPDDNWSRIVSELLGRAGITINGSSPSDPQVKHPDFFKRVLQEGSLGLGESYMDGWWECERLDIFFASVLRAGLENQLPHHLKDTLRIAAARLFNLQSRKNAPGSSAKSITISATTCFQPHAGSFHAILLRLLERARRRLRRHSRPSCV